MAEENFPSFSGEQIENQLSSDSTKAQSSAINKKIIADQKAEESQKTVDNFEKNKIDLLPKNDSYNLFAVRLGYKMVPDEEKQGPLPTYAIAQHYNGKAPIVPKKDEALDMWIRNGQDPNQFEDFYQYVTNEAKAISFGNVISAEERMMTTLHVNGLIGGYDPSKLPSESATYYSYLPKKGRKTYLTDQQELEANGVYEDIEGNIKALKDWKPAETVLTYNPLSQTGMWKERGNKEALDNQMIRDISGPTERKTNPVTSFADGFAKGSLGLAISGTGGLIRMFDEGDGYGAYLQNLNRYWFGKTNYDEQEGMFDNPAAFLSTVGQGMGSTLLFGGTGLAGGLAGVGMNAGMLTLGTPIAAGSFYDQALQEGMDETTGLKATAWIAGLVEMGVETAFGADMNFLMKKTYRSEIFNTIPKEILQKQTPLNNQEKQFVFDKVKSIVENTIKKSKSLVDKAEGTRIGGAVTGAVTESTEEIITGVGHETIKNFYNLGSQMMYESSLEEYEKSMSVLSQKESRLFTDIDTGKFFEELPDGTTVEISEKTYNTKRADLKNRMRLVKDLHKDNLNYAEDGTISKKGSLFDTDWSKVNPFEHTDEGLAGFFSTLPLGLMRHNKHRMNKVVEYVAQGKSKDLLDDIDAKEKAGAWGPTNIDAKTGEIFDPKTEPNKVSLNKVNADLARQEVKLAMEMIAGTRFNPNKDQWDGIDLLKNDIIRNVQDRSNATATLNDLKEALSTSTDDTEKKNIEEQIKEKEEILNDLNQEFSELTEKSSDTGYTKKFNELSKELVLKYNGTNLTPERVREGHDFRQAKIEEIKKKAQEDAASIVKETTTKEQDVVSSIGSYSNINDYLKGINEKIKKISSGKVSQATNQKISSEIENLEKSYFQPKIEQITNEFLASASQAEIDQYKKYNKEFSTILELRPDVLNQFEEYGSFGNLKATAKGLSTYTDEKALEQELTDKFSVEYLDRHKDSITVDYNNIKSDVDGTFVGPDTLSRLRSQKEELLRDKDFLIGQVSYNKIRVNDVPSDFHEVSKKEFPSWTIKENISLKREQEINDFTKEFHGQNLKTSTDKITQDLLNVNSQIFLIDNAIEIALKKSGVTNKRDVLLSGKDILSKVHALNFISQRLSSELHKNVQAIINDPKVLSHKAYFNDDSRTEDELREAILVVDNAYLLASSLIHSSGELLKGNLYKTIANEYLSRPILKIAGHQFTDSTDFNTASFEAILMSGALEKDLSTNTNVETKEVTLNLQKEGFKLKRYAQLYPAYRTHIANVLTSIAYVDEAVINASYVKIANDEKRVPSYAQIKSATQALAYVIGDNKILSDIEEGHKKSTNFPFQENTILRASQIMGYAGSGKTSVAIREFLKLLRMYSNGDITVKGFAPSESLTETLNQSLKSASSGVNIKLDTVKLHDNISSLSDSDVNSGDVFFFDESSLLDTDTYNKIKSLQDAAIKSNKKVLFIFAGDESQASWDTKTLSEPPALRYLPRTSPLTRVFRSGVSDIVNIQSTLRKAYNSLDHSDPKFVFGLPTLSFYSSKSKKLGAQVSLSKDRIINEFIDYLKSVTLSSLNSQKQKDVMLIVSTNAERVEMVKRVSAELGVPTSDVNGLVFSIEKSDFMAPGLEAKYVFAIPTIQPTQRVKGYIQTLLTSSSRATEYLHLYYDSTQSQFTNKEVSDVSEIVVIDNSIDDKTITKERDFLKRKAQNLIDSKSIKSNAEFEKEKFNFDNKTTTTVATTTPPTPPTAPTPPPASTPPPTPPSAGPTIIPRDEVIKDIFDNHKEGDLVSVRYNDGTGFKSVLATIKGSSVFIVKQEADGSYTVTKKHLPKAKVQYFEYAKHEGNLPTTVEDRFLDDSENPFAGKRFVEAYSGTIYTGQFKNEEESEGAYIKNGVRYYTFDTDKGKVTLNDGDVLYLVGYKEEEYIDDMFLEEENTITDDIDNNSEGNKATRLFAANIEKGKIVTGVRGIIVPDSSTNFSPSDIRSAKAEIMQAVFHMKNSNYFKVVTGELIGYKAVSDDGIANISVNGYITLNKEVLPDYILSLINEKVIELGVDETSLLYVSPLYLPDRSTNVADGKFTYEEVMQDDFYKKLQALKDKGVFSDEEFNAQLIKAGLLKGDVSISNSGIIEYLKNGRIQKDDGINTNSISDLSDRIKNYYKYTGLVQVINPKNNKPEHRAVFLSMIDGSEFTITVRPNTYDPNELEKLYKGITPSEYSHSNKDEKIAAGEKLEKTEAYQTFLFNRSKILGILSSLPDEVSSLVESKNGYIKPVGKTKVDQAKSLKEFLSNLHKFNHVLYKPTMINKKVGKGNITLVDDLSLHTGVTNINDPFFGISFDANEKIENIISQSYFTKPKTEAYNSNEFISPEEAIAEVMSMFGQEGFFTAENLISNLTSRKGEALYGLVTSGRMFLDSTDNKVLKRAISHEISHVIYNYVLTPKQKRRLQTAVNKLAGREVENVDEWLAENIETYDVKTNSFSIESEINALIAAEEESRKNLNIIQKLFKWIKDKLFGSTDDIIKYYADIKSGMYKGRAISENLPLTDEEFEKVKKQKKNFNNKHEILPKFGNDMNVFYDAVEYVSSIIYDKSTSSRNFNKYVEENDYAEIAAKVSSTMKLLARDEKNNTAYTFEVNGQKMTTRPSYFNQDISMITGSIRDNDPALMKFYKDYVIQTLAKDDNINYVLKHIIPGLSFKEINEVKSSYKVSGIEHSSDNPIKARGLVLDGVLGINESLKFVLGRQKYKVNGEYKNFDVNNDFRMLQQMAAQNMQIGSSTKISDFGRSLKSLVDSYGDQVYTHEVPAKMFAIYNAFFRPVNIDELKLSGLIKVKDKKGDYIKNPNGSYFTKFEQIMGSLSYYAMSEQADDIINAILEKDSLLKLATKTRNVAIMGKVSSMEWSMIDELRKRNDDAKLIMGAIETDMFSLVNNKFSVTSIYKTGSKLFTKIFRPTGTIISDIKNSLKNSIVDKYFKSNGENITPKDLMLENFLGIITNEKRTTIGNTVEVSYDFNLNENSIKVFVDSNKKTISVRNSKGYLVPVISFAQKGSTLSFTPVDAVTGSLKEDYKSAIGSLFGYLGLAKTLGYSVHNNLVSLSPTQTFGDPADGITFNTYIESLGMIAIANHNNAVEYYKSLTSKEEQDKNLKSDIYFNDAYLATAVISENDKSISVDSNTDVEYVSNEYTKPNELHKHIDYLSKAKYSIVSTKSGYNFIIGPDGGKSYNITLGSYITRIFRNVDGYSSLKIASYISDKIAEGKRAYHRALRENMIVTGELNVRETVINLGAKGSVRGASFDKLNDKDRMDVYVANFFDTAKRNDKRFFVPVSYVGERSFEVGLLFESKRKFFDVSYSNKRYFTETYDSVYFDWIKKRYAQTEDAANESLFIFADKLNLYSEGLFKPQTTNPKKLIIDIYTFLSSFENHSILIDGFNSDQGIKDTVDYMVTKDGKLTLGRPTKSFYDSKQFGGDNIFNFENKDLITSEYKSSNEYELSSLDVLFQKEYSDFVDMIYSINHFVPEHLQYGFNMMETHKDKVYMYDNSYYKFDSVRSDIKKDNTIDPRTKDVMIEAERQKYLAGRNNFSKKLHPFYKAMYFTHLMANIEQGQITLGDTYMYPNIEAIVKRSHGTTATGKLVTQEISGGLKPNYNVVSLNSEHPIFSYAVQNVRDKSVLKDKADGASYMNPFIEKAIRNTSKESVGEKSSMKLSNFYVDYETGDIKYIKDSKVMITDDFLNYSTSYGNILKYMLGPMVYPMYEAKIAEGKTHSEAIDELAPEVLNNDELYYSMVHEISPTSTQKAMKLNHTPVEEVLSGNRTELTNVNTIKLVNNMIQLNAESDIETLEGKSMSQILSFLSIASYESATKAYDALSKFAEKGMNRLFGSIYNEDGSINRDEFKKRYRNIQKDSSNKANSAFEEIVNNPLMSLNFPSIIQTGLYNIASEINSFIKPTLKAIRLNQVPDIFVDVFEYVNENGQVEVLSLKDVKSKGVLDNVTPRKLKPVMYFDASGNRIQKEEDFKRIIMSGEKVTSTPGEILIPYSRVEHFQIEGLTLNEAQSILTNKGRIYIGDNLELVSQVLSSEDYVVIDPRFQQYDFDATKIENYFAAFNHSLDSIDIRIPSHSFASGGIYKVVGFINNSGSSIIKSPEKTFIDGSDFDIDQVTLYFKSTSVDEEDNHFLDDYARNEDEDGLNNEIFNAVYDAYLNPSSMMVDIATRRTNVDSLQNFKEQLRKEGKLNSSSFKQIHSLTSSLYFAGVTKSGNTMIGIEANLTKVYGNLDYAYKYAVKNGQKYLAEQLAKHFPILVTGRSTSGRPSLDIVGEFLNAATDNQREQILGFININESSQQIISSMIMSGSDIDTILQFINSDHIIEFVKRMQSNRGINDYQFKTYVNVVNDMILEREGKIGVVDFDSIIAEKTKRLNELSVKLSPQNQSDDDTNIIDYDPDTLQPIYGQSQSASSGTDEDFEEIKNLESEIRSLEEAKNSQPQQQAGVYQEISDLRNLKSIYAKGEYLNRLIVAFGLNQGIDGNKYQLLERTIQDLEYSSGKKLEDFGSEELPRTDYMNKYIHKTTAIYNSIKESEELIRVYPDIDKVVSNVPHIRYYISILTSLKEIMKEFVYFNPSTEIVKERMFDKLRIKNFISQSQFISFHKMIDDFIAGAYFKSRKITLPLSNRMYDESSLITGNTHHDLSTSEGIHMFLVDFPKTINQIKDVYDSMVINGTISSKERNYFLENIEVDSHGTGGFAEIVKMKNTLLNDEIDIRGDFHKLETTINKVLSNSKILNHPTVDTKKSEWRDMFRAYSILKFGFVFKKGTLMDMVGPGIKESKTLLTDMSKFIDSELIPSMDNYQNKSENYIHKMMDNMDFIGLMYESKLSVPLSKKRLESIYEKATAGNSALANTLDKSAKVYEDPNEAGDFYSQSEFIKKFLPLIRSRFDYNKRQYVPEILTIANIGTERMIFSYQQVNLTYPLQAIPYMAENDLFLGKDIITLRNISSDDLIKLRSNNKGNFSKKVKVSLKANAYFSYDDVKEKNTIKKVFIPLVGYANMIYENPNLVTIKPLNYYSSNNNLFNEAKVELNLYKDNDLSDLQKITDFVVGYTKENKNISLDVAYLFAEDYKKGNFASVEEYISIKEKSLNDGC